MLIWAEEFLDMLYGRRIVWISGRLGSGKTALAYRLALEIVKRKRSKYIVSNVIDAVSTPIEQVVKHDGKLRCCVILDEAGKWIRTRDISDQYRADLRKLDLIMIMPSNLEPTLNLRRFKVYVLIDLGYVGIPAKIIKWRYKEDDAEITGYFVWWDYREIYGVFKTSQIVEDDGGIAGWIAKEAGRGNNTRFDGGDNGLVADVEGASMVKALQNQSANLEDIYDIIENGGQVFSGKKRKR